MRVHLNTACTPKATTAQWLMLGLLSASACAATAPSGTGAGASDASSDGKAAVGATLSYSVENSRTILQWPEDEWPFHCVRLSQQLSGQAKVDIPLCNKIEGRNKIVVGNAVGAGVDFTWDAFKALRVGPISWSLQGGDKFWGVTPKDVGKGTATVGPHFGGPCQTATTKATGLDEWHFTAPATLDVTVALGEAAQNSVAIIKPDILVDHVTASGNAGKGGTIKFKYTMTQKGMYIFEVNNTGGGAILNCAVYVSADLPLAPVEVGGGAGLATNPSEAQLTKFRQKLLDLTNGERAKVNLGMLALDDTLNKIAQYHSEDMGANKYFAHVSPSGEGPGDRAKKFGWTKGIGENIASNLSVEGAHNGLFWSAGHRANILGSGYKVVGFGIAKDGGGSNMLVTENFGD